MNSYNNYYAIFTISYQWMPASSRHLEHPGIPVRLAANLSQYSHRSHHFLQAQLAWYTPSPVRFP